jgi:hypothetical protein
VPPNFVLLDTTLPDVARSDKPPPRDGAVRANERYQRRAAALKATVFSGIGSSNFPLDDGSLPARAGHHKSRLFRRF